MSGKEVSLIGEVHVSTSSVYTTVDALEALKCIGMTYGLYDHAEDLSNARVMLEKGEHPALVVQEDISHHGSPCWKTVRMITDDPGQILRYLAFRETVQMIHQMEMERDRQPVPGKPPQQKKKGGHAHER